MRLGATVIISSSCWEGSRVASWCRAFWYCAASRAAARMFWLSAEPEPSVEMATGTPGPQHVHERRHARTQDGVGQGVVHHRGAAGGEQLHVPGAAVDLVGQHGAGVQDADLAGSTPPGSGPARWTRVNQRVVRGSSELWMWNRVPWSRAQAFWGTRAARLLEKHWSGPGHEPGPPAPGLDRQGPLQPRQRRRRGGPAARRRRSGPGRRRPRSWWCRRPRWRRRCPPGGTCSSCSGAPWRR